MAHDTPATEQRQQGAQPKPVGLIWRGLLMGLAEVVPGVSGGTIAFVTGIYGNLVGGLAKFGPASFRHLSSWRAFSDYHQVPFFLWLGVGMLGGVVVFARLMTWLLELYEPVVWAFFSGLILMSVWVIGRERARPAFWGWAVIGLVAGLAMVLLLDTGGSPAQGKVAGWMLFCGGAIAISAWLLPAVSGSFLLLVLGLYVPVVTAIAEFDFGVLILFAAGCAVGVLLFSRVLVWLLEVAREPVLSVLVGFMAGASLRLWPWQSQTELGATQYLWATTYAQEVGAAFALQAVVAAMAGAGLMYLISRQTPEEKHTS